MKLYAGALYLLLLALLGCHAEPQEPEPPPLVAVGRVATQDDPVSAIPTDLHFDAAKVALGRRLFADPVLSPGGDVACTTCHLFEKGGADGRAKSDLAGHARAIVNTPTIFNVTFNYRFHWSGKFDDLDVQLETPIISPRVLATSYDAIVGRLRASPDYVTAFRALYPEGVTTDSFRDALVTYERSLVTPNSRFDKFITGDKTALTDDERAGYSLFKSRGCISCHQGVNIGGNLFQRFGAMHDYFKDRGHVEEADYGRYNITKKEEDRFVFRVASLRNVAKTAPYFHDGSAKTLEEAVQTMSKYQLGRALSAENTRLVVAFLGTLTGEYEGQPLP